MGFGWGGGALIGPIAAGPAMDASPFFGLPLVIAFAALRSPCSCCFGAAGPDRDARCGRAFRIATRPGRAGDRMEAARSADGARRAAAGWLPEGALSRRCLGGSRGSGDVNISAGNAAGDTLSTRVEAGEEDRSRSRRKLRERLYRALPGSPPACVRNKLRAAHGARLEWPPQERFVRWLCAGPRVGY